MTDHWNQELVDAALIEVVEAAIANARAYMPEGVCAVLDHEPGARIETVYQITAPSPLFHDAVIYSYKRLLRVRIDNPRDPIACHLAGFRPYDDGDGVEWGNIPI